ncbi:hypothetical protein HMPREF1531_01764 [Propionibacterium sp. oral taxon 192 str. F0372]|uniref:LutC/YkgG family protein n=1 Tax=Propionibacterium sp. oral taxon 192 TaxID=671222 RepID=UPI000352D9AB|nr:LUD domain-containing protein [Propionibacterium sp. oral taxon 192]EPH02458.1 hypothetical protein HMPREF1531_01764 [Propionibacterium sp. oral taxon 192 str. F0372]
MNAKDEILARVRSALRDVPGNVAVAEDSPVDWKYGQQVDVGDVIETFIERVIDYKATVIKCPVADVPAEIAKGLKALEVKSVVIGDGVDEKWREAIEGAGAKLYIDTPGQQLSALELNEVDAVVSAAAAGSAETGTIVLDHRPDQGRRALSLVPDSLICVIRADQVYSSVPEVVTKLGPSVKEDGLPLTWISGPSATSDIELSRVEGVHGPRNLYVIVQE